MRHKMSKLLVCCFLFTIGWLRKANSNLDDVADVELILIGMRHGNRNPENFLPGDPNYPNNWGYEGDLQLNSYGKVQAYGTGEMLRDRYGGLLSDYFNTKETKVYSSSADRCQMTTQMAMAGLYPPKEWQRWNKDVDWQPVPIEINDPILRMYHIDCPASDKGWQPIDDDNLPELYTWMEKTDPLMSYIQEHTGWNKSMSKMADVADNVLNIQRLGRGEWSYPDWIENPQKIGMTRDEIVSEILDYGENHQIACANYAPCRDIMGGHWLNNVLDFLQKKAADPNSPLKLVFYASHTEITMSIMKLLGVEVEEVPTAAGFIVEFRSKPYPAVRLLYHEPVQDGDYSITEVSLATMHAPCKLADGTETDWCPLNTFLRNVNAFAQPDWEEACGIDSGCVALDTKEAPEDGPYKTFCENKMPVWPEPSASPLGKYYTAAVAADNGLCSEIGRDAMIKGGNAVDALVATVLCIGVMNCHSSGLGGGNFMVLYNSTTEDCTTIDNREQAPAASHVNLFKDIRADSPTASQVGWLAPGIPGELHGLWTAYKLYGGKVPWSTLVMPTVNLLRDGLPVSSSLAHALDKEREDVLNEDSLSEIFINPATGKLYKSGEVMKRPVLADTMEKLAKAQNPAELFYKGQIAEDLASEFAENDGIITKEDLEQYKPTIRNPLLMDVGNGLTACAMPPPSGGAVTLSILNVMSHEGISPETHLDTIENTAVFYHRFIEAMKYAYAARSDLSDSSYNETAMQIANEIISKRWGFDTGRSIEDRAQTQSDYGGVYANRPHSGTTHVSVVDAQGNAASATCSINLYFGSKRRSQKTGIILNDHMDDFSTPGEFNAWGFPPSPANFIQPGKKPQSSMSPIVVYNTKSGQVELVLGAEGGSHIISTVAYVATRVLWLNETIKQAIDARRLHNQHIPLDTQYEAGFPEMYQKLLEDMGQVMKEIQANQDDSAVACGVVRQPDGTLYANSDFRKGTNSYCSGF